MPSLRSIVGHVSRWFRQPLALAAEARMKQFNESGWNNLCAAAGATPGVSFVQISAHYSEPHRAYHNARHIDACLAEFDSACAEALNTIAVEFAIWFHDVIYVPRSSTNEEQSAALAHECLQESNPALAKLVAELILTTKTHSPGSIQDAPLLLDIDLSIRGKEHDPFSEFEAGIRSEYAWVPSHTYRAKRAEILRRFLNRDRIYLTKLFHHRYEPTARKNLSKLISTLEAGT